MSNAKHIESNELVAVEYFEPLFNGVGPKSRVLGPVAKKVASKPDWTAMAKSATSYDMFADMANLVAK